MELTILTTLLVAVQYFVFAIMVGKSRGEKSIPAPRTVGDEKFERVFRVQQNTVEQLIVFFPALWIFGYYVSDAVGALLGLVFLVGRAMYARGYLQDPDKRGPGFVVGTLALLILLIGGLVGVGQSLLRV